MGQAPALPSRARALLTSMGVVPTAVNMLGQCLIMDGVWVLHGASILRGTLDKSLSLEQRVRACLDLPLGSLLLASAGRSISATRRGVDMNNIPQR